MTLISDILEKLDTLKQEYDTIKNKYNSIHAWDDMYSNFGSGSWFNYYEECYEASDRFKYNEEDYRNADIKKMNPNNYDMDIIIKDHQRVRNIIMEVTEIFKISGLSQFLFEEDPSYWLGVLPEPESSAY